MGAMRVEPTGDPQGPHKEGSLVYQSWQSRPQGLPTPSMFLILASEGDSSSPRLQDFSSQRRTVLRQLVSCKAAAQAARCSREAQGHRAAH